MAACLLLLAMAALLRQILLELRASRAVRADSELACLELQQQHCGGARSNHGQEHDASPSCRHKHRGRQDDCDVDSVHRGWRSDVNKRAYVVRCFGLL